MRQYDVSAAQRRKRRDTQVRVRAHARELRALDQTVEERGDLGPVSAISGSRVRSVKTAAV